MDDKQKSRTYFDRHSSTIINRNGYWNYDYRVTTKILKRRNVKKLIDSMPLSATMSTTTSPMRRISMPSSGKASGY